MAHGRRVERLSIDESRKFAALVRSEMAECGIASIERLHLCLDVDDVSRATLYRWLSGRVRIPVSRAHELSKALARYLGRSESAMALGRWLDGALSETQSAEERLKREFLVRGVRVGPALEAVRAAQLLSADSQQR